LSTSCFSWDLENYLRSRDTEEQTPKSHAGMLKQQLVSNVTKTTDPYSPLRTDRRSTHRRESPFSRPIRWKMINPTKAFLSLPTLPPFPSERGLYDDDYEDNKSFRSEDYDGRSRYTTNRDDSVSKLGTESYAPLSKYVSRTQTKRGLLAQEEAPRGGDTGRRDD